MNSEVGGGQGQGKWTSLKFPTNVEEALNEANTDVIYNSYNATHLVNQL